MTLTKWMLFHYWMIGGGFALAEIWHGRKRLRAQSAIVVIVGSLVTAIIWLPLVIVRLVTYERK